MSCSRKQCTLNTNNKVVKASCYIFLVPENYITTNSINYLMLQWFIFF